MYANMNTKTSITKPRVYRCDQQEYILNLADYIKRLNGHPVWRGLQLPQQQQPQQQQQQQQQLQQQQQQPQQQQQQQQQQLQQQQQQQQQHNGENINPQVEQNKDCCKPKLKQRKLQQTQW